MGNLVARKQWSHAGRQGLPAGLWLVGRCYCSRPLRVEALVNFLDMRPTERKHSFPRRMERIGHCTFDR